MQGFYPCKYENQMRSRIEDLFIQRPRGLASTGQALKRSPVVPVLGPRQCAKTTLAHQLAGADLHFFDLESLLGRQALSVAAELTLAPLRGMVVLDEVQTLALAVV